MPFRWSILMKQPFLIEHFRVTFCYENVFHLQAYFHANQTYFHLQGFTREFLKDTAAQ